MRGWPAATIVFYGPNLSRATKVAVGIVPSEGAEPAEMRDWKVETGDVRADTAVAGKILEFIESHGVLSIVMADGIMGCPHQEGVDYEGEWCPSPDCTFWHARPLYGEANPVIPRPQSTCIHQSERLRERSARLGSLIMHFEEIWRAPGVRPTPVWRFPAPEWPAASEARAPYLGSVLALAAVPEPWRASSRLVASVFWAFRLLGLAWSLEQLMPLRVDALPGADYKLKWRPQGRARRCSPANPSLLARGPC